MRHLCSIRRPYLPIGLAAFVLLGCNSSTGGGIKTGTGGQIALTGGTIETGGSARSGG